MRMPKGFAHFFMGMAQVIIVLKKTKGSTVA